MQHPANDPTLDLPQLKTAADLSTVLGLKTHTIYTLVREGRLPCVRIGRVVRFDVDRVRDFIASGGTSNGNKD